MARVFRFEEFGYEVEIGKVAQQANGAVWFNYNGTIVLATATSSKTTDFPGFLPLTIEYREQYAAAGKIPGGYYKREGKPADREILTGRLIDRAIRPLFPENYFDQVQVLATVYSINKDYMPNTISLLASSLALVISDIPFIEPVGAVEVARINGEWIFNPTYPQFVASDVRLIVAGTKDGICMVEGSLNELSEKELVDIMFTAHEKCIKPIVAWQEKIRTEVGKNKKEIADTFSWNFWTEKIESFLDEQKINRLYHEDKTVRNESLADLKKQFNMLHEQEFATREIPQSVLDFIFESSLKEKLTALICQRKKRVDGRDFTTVRPIAVEVGVLPFTHGSCLFTRGKTQALVTTTLGSGEDAQRIENLMAAGKEESETFLLNYNALPFSYGDVRPLRGPGRRDIGHGYLARSAFAYMMPTQENFPYTIRVVSDILESDGSTSMATACGTTMSLMHAGVPLRKMIAGIAMGLLYSEQDGTFIPLTDISGFEDAFGLMDFKVIGTGDGITAIQMDIKHKGGLHRSIFEGALSQAKDGRLSILSVMEKVMSKPNPELSPLVPKVITISIAPDKIGAIIGSGGKTIREIIDVTKTAIDIEDSGLVKIFGGPETDLARAITWIKVLAGKIDIGSIFQGEVKRIAEFGIFVELVPGYDGLLHISNIPKDQQKNLSKLYKIGDKIIVEILDHDESTSRTSLKLVQNASEK
jgi:polyribonucleotide nucleotidyltransferase